MARAGIYKSEVVRARNNLQAMGRYPSIDAIRTELGNTGSKGTIHRYLKEIEEDEGGSTGTQVAVSDAIQDLSARLAERLHEEADKRVSEAQEKHLTEVLQFKESINSLRLEADSFRTQLERTQLELADERTKHAGALVSLQQEKIVCAQLMQQVHDLEELLAGEERHRQSLEEKHQHAREALEHFRQSAKEQREQDQRQHDQQIQFLQGELRSTKDTLGAKQQEAIHSHQDNARLSNELTHAKSELHQLQSELRSLRNLKEQLIISEQKNENLSQQIAEKEAAFATLTGECNRESVASTELRDRNQQLEIELASVKAAKATQEQIIENIREHFSTQSKAPPATKQSPRKTQETLFDTEG